MSGSIESYQTQAIVFNNAGRAFVYNTVGISVLDAPYTSVAFTIPVANPDSGAIGISPDGNTLLTTNFSPQVRIFHAPFSAISTPALLTIPGNGELDGIAVTPDGTTAIVVSSTSSPQGVSAISAPFSSASIVQALPLPAGLVRPFEDVGISPDSQLAILTGNGATEPAVLIKAPFTTAGATSSLLPIVNAGDPNRGAGAVRFQPPELAPELTVSKTAPATVVSRSNLTYTITYGNNGPVAANNAIIRDPLPVGTSFVSATNGGQLVGSDVVFNVGSLGAGVTGQTVSFTVTVNTLGGGTVNNNHYTIEADGVAPVAGPPVQTGVTTAPPTLGDYANTSVVVGGNTTIVPSDPPTDTTSINVSTNARFLGNLTADPVTGVVRVTNAHPAATYSVKVKAFGPAGTVTRLFLLTVTNGTVCPGSIEFTSPAVPQLPVGNAPASVAIGDLNNDGHQDLVAANLNSSSVSIRLGDGAGGFTSPADPQVGVAQGPESVAIGDFNNDGNQDFATANRSNNSVSVGLGDGTGRFLTLVQVTVASGPRSVAIGDFNNDGNQDFATANSNANNVSIRLGDGEGGFTSPTVPEVLVGINPSSVAIGDFNNDLLQDFATVNSSSNNVSIHLGNGAGGFTLPAVPEVPVGTGPISVALGDFNNDGNQDLATANGGSTNVSIRLGNGTGGFTLPPVAQVTVGTFPFSVAIGDFNNDGNQDLAAANVGTSSNNVSIRMGDGAGGFTSPTVAQVSVGTFPQSVAIGDLNNDGRQDFATANSNSNNVSIRLGGCPGTPPTPTPTPTATPTTTPTATPTATPTPTPTATPTATPTPAPPTLGDYANTGVVLAGNTTITPSVPPTNTTSVNVSTNSSFNGELTADPVTGVVRITNAHPAGVYTVTVTAFGPGGMTTETFGLTVTSGTACTGIGFTSPAVPQVPAGSSPASVAIGDLNNDGHQDIAAANFSSASISIRLGDGAGGFTSPTIPQVSVGTGPESVAIGDFNRDGNQDLATANFNSASVSIRLGDGAGGFTSPAVAQITVATGPRSVAIGDFNNDGRPDLATANSNSNNISIRLGDGADGFTSPTVAQVAVGTNPVSVAIGDFNGDGFQDFATTNFGVNNVSIRLGDGTGGFSSPAVSEIAVGTGPFSLAIGDFNSDGDQDLATANGSSINVSIRLGDGAGGFTSPTVPQVTVGTFPFSVAIADFNNDGNQDFATANSNPNNVSIRLGNGAGGFTSPTVAQVSVGTFPRSVAIGDFNNDGRQDFAAANSSSNNVSIRLGGCTDSPTPTPTATPTPNTPIGIDVIVSAPTNDAKTTFDQVTVAGTTTFAPISPPSSAGTPPPGYTILDNDPAYDITTTATYTLPVTVCFTVSSINDEPTFSRVRVLHGEAGSLVDRTILPPNEPAPDFPTREACANVDSLSPFVLALAPEAGMGFENDVTPRANGDGIVISGDVIQMRRFATGLDTPALDPNEYQRADSAPRATLGDGIVNAGDVIQARRYATSLDPATPAAGPTGPSMVPNAIARVFDDVYAYFFGREIRVSPQKPEREDTVTVAVEITSYGDEVATGFTLEYDAAKLLNPRIALADGAPEGAVLTANTSEAGKIGILVDSTEAFMASAVPKSFLIVTFDVAKGASGETPISLTDNLAARSTADANGNTLNVRYIDSKIHLPNLISR
ncbi:MAG: FG-GAP-like repeat-containing protein [Pyrinomonadaceae bacterium]